MRWRSRFHTSPERRARRSGARPAAPPCRSSSGSVSVRRVKLMRSLPAPRAEAGAQVGPGLAERVLVQRRLAALGAHALLDHVGGDVGQAGLCRRVAAVAGIEVDLHVDDRQRVGVDEIDPGAAGLASSARSAGRPGRLRGQPAAATASRRSGANACVVMRASVQLLSVAQARRAAGAACLWSGGSGPQGGHGQLVVAEVVGRHRLHLLCGDAAAGAR